MIVAFAVLLVAFSVFMGGYGLCVSAGDPQGSLILWWVAMFALMLLIIDVILLVATLAIAFLMESPKLAPKQPANSVHESHELVE